MLFVSWKQLHTNNKERRYEDITDVWGGGV